MVQTLSLSHPVLPFPAAELPRRVRAAVEAGREEADALRRLPTSLLEALRAAGAFRLYTPRELGGFEIGLVEMVDLLERVARLDGPVAWNVWNGNVGFAAALMDERGVARIWGDEPDPVIVNSARPMGRATPTADGFVLSGRWDIVSGIDSADWVALFGMAAGDVPDVLVFFVPRSDIAVIDTWDVSGMRGTGSGSVVVDGAFVPDELAVSPFAPPRIDRPLYRIPAFTLASTGCAAAVLGIAGAALDEVVALAAGKPTDTGAPLAMRAHAQAAVARSDTALRAALAVLRAAAADVEEAAAAREPVTMALRGPLRAAMCHAAATAREVLTTTYTLGSSTALYRGNRLERLFRDGFAAAQHGVLAASHLETAGRIRLGVDPQTPIF